jgi:hypothetical protein
MCRGLAMLPVFMRGARDRVSCNALHGRNLWMCTDWWLVGWQVQKSSTAAAADAAFAFKASVDRCAAPSPAAPLGILLLGANAAAGSSQALRRASGDSGEGPMFLGRTGMRCPQPACACAHSGYEHRQALGSSPEELHAYD